MGFFKVIKKALDQKAQQSSGTEATREQEEALYNLYRLGDLAKQHGWSRGSQRQAFYDTYGKEIYDTVQTLMGSPYKDRLAQEYTANKVGKQKSSSWTRLFNTNSFDRHMISDLGSRENFPEMMETLARMSNSHYTSTGWERPSSSNPNPAIPDDGWTTAGPEPAPEPEPPAPEPTTPPPPTTEPPGPPAPPQPAPPGNPDAFEGLGAWGYRDASPNARTDAFKMESKPPAENPFKNADGSLQGEGSAGASYGRRVTQKGQPVLQNIGEPLSAFAQARSRKLQKDSSRGLNRNLMQARGQANTANANNRAGVAATEQTRAGIQQQMQPPQPPGPPPMGPFPPPGPGAVPITGMIDQSRVDQQAGMMGPFPPQPAPPGQPLPGPMGPFPPRRFPDPNAQPPAPARPTPPQFSGAGPLPAGGGPAASLTSQPQPGAVAKPTEQLDVIDARRQTTPGMQRAPAPQAPPGGMLGGYQPPTAPSPPDPNAPAPGPMAPRTPSANQPTTYSHDRDLLLRRMMIGNPPA